MEKDLTIPPNLLKKLNEQRRKEFCCDLMLESKDGTRFSVHKNVLATYPYFEYKIERLDKTSSCEKIDLDMTAKQLEIVINYLYTGEVIVTDFSDIIDLYGTADEIDLTFLKDYSTRKLIDSITLPFAFQYWEHAVKYDIKSLMTHCIKLIADNTEEFFKNYLSCFKNDNDFLKLIEYRKEFRIDEIEFYRIIRKWIGKNYGLRKKYVDSILLKKVDYSQICTSIIHEEILTDQYLRNHKTFYDEMLKIINKTSDSTESLEVVLPENHSISFLNNSTISRPGICSTVAEFHPVASSDYNQISCSTENIEKSIYLINTDKVEIYKINFDIKSTLFSINLEYNNILDYQNYSTCNINNNNNECILFSGGFNNEKQCYHQENFIWTGDSFDKLPNLLKSRYGHRVIFTNNQIYSCGGKTQKGFTKSTEIFDFGSKSWIDGPNFENVKTDFGLTSLDNILYAFGSYNDNVERLDPRDRNKKWEIISANNSNYYKSIPLSAHTILCTGFSFRNFSIFDIRKCAFITGKLSGSGTGKSRASYDIFEVDNIIHCYNKYNNNDIDMIYKYEYEAKGGWCVNATSNIDLKSNISYFNVVTLRN